MFYAISGINGDYEAYKRALKKLKFQNLDDIKEEDIMNEEAVISTLEGEDVLYVLGNIIGAGGGSMKILQDMMSRDNVIAVVGENEYIERENIEIPSLYFAKERPVVYRDGNIIMVDDDRMKLRPGEKIEMKSVRFRTLGCYPLTGGVESTADTLPEIIEETLSAVSSERTTRVIDNEAAGSMERRKREGYF